MKKYLAVLTRCRDEFYIKEWVDYYQSQNVDSIYIIDDDSNDKTIYDFVNDEKYNNVDIIFASRSYGDSNTMKNCKLDKNSQVNKLFRDKIKHSYEWLIYCDVDEFITTKKNADLTLSKQLQQINSGDIKAIGIPWVLMSGGNLKHQPTSVLKEITYRHDHDIRHFHSVRKFRCRYGAIEYKCILKPENFEYLTDHEPFPHVELHNGIDLKQTRFRNKRFINLRNKDIDTGVFLCYHYRYISDQNAKNKLQTNGWYINDGYTFEDLKTSTYPEIHDNTMLKKIHDQ
tara:strand:+ start:163 stop:1020 length:858 start_codon:yes stop_codon:yes gene_type:complete